MSTPIQPLPRDAAKKLDYIGMEVSTALKNVKSTMRDKDLDKDKLLVLVNDLTLSFIEIQNIKNSIKTE